MNAQNNPNHASQFNTAHRSFNPQIVQDPILLTKDELLDLEVHGIIKEMGGFLALTTHLGNRWYFLTDGDLDEALYIIRSVHLKISLNDAIKGLAQDVFYQGYHRLDNSGRPMVSVSAKNVGENLWTIKRDDSYDSVRPTYQAIIYHESHLDGNEISREINAQLIKLQRRRIKLYKMWAKAKVVKGDLVLNLSGNRSLSITMNDLCYAVGTVCGAQHIYRNEVDLLNDLKLYL